MDDIKETNFEQFQNSNQALGLRLIILLERGLFEIVIIVKNVLCKS